MMIKNIAIGGVVGLLFMSGGFYVGMRFVHVPVPKPALAASTTAKPAPPSRDAISVDALRKTSESMLDVNQALQAREQAVAAREKKALQREDELDAERAALDRSHEKFHELYGEFKQHLQLVNANETDQLQRQLTIYTTMDPAEAADLIRSLDDGTIVRLFSMMDTKPLAKLVSAWKTKYPGDSARLLTALTQMGRVMPEDKVALSDAAPSADAGTNAAPTTEALSNSGAAPEALSAPANIASTDTGSPAAANDASTASTPDSAPTASDATSSTAPAASADSDTGNNAPTPAAAPSPATDPAATGQPNYSTPDANAPSGTSATPASTSDATPAAAPLAPPPEPAAAPASTSIATPSDTTDSTAQLGVPGETAAEAAEAAQRRTGQLSADISNDRAY
jgi:flagellar motility protein MotE (MotC chaperone)